MQNKIQELDTTVKITKDSILNSVREYYKENHVKQSRKDFYDDSDFIEGITPVPYAGRVFNEEEMVNSASALLDFWLTLGEHGKSFEDKFANFLGVKKSILTNSGSSANLLTISALTSHKLGAKRLLTVSYTHLTLPTINWV